MDCQTPHHTLRIALAALLLMAVLPSGCAADAYEGQFDPSADAGPIDEDQYRDALTALASHQIASAGDIYQDLHQQDPADGEAAAGVAITDILLLPGLDPSDTVWINHTDADSAGLEATNAIYADQGYLYWISRGAQWQSEGQFDGIKNLIADRLPWPESRLDSLAAFVEGLTQQVGEARGNLRSVAERIRTIESMLEVALADPGFERFVLPGEALQDKRLTLTLGKSEIAALAGALAAARGALRFMIAYEHQYTLEEAFGPQWEMKANDMNADNPEWTAWDYSVDFLDEKLVRTKAGGAITDLKAARNAFVKAADFGVRSIDHGLTESQETTFKWREVDPAYAEKLRDVLSAFKKSLASRTELPHTDPATSADFSPVFEPGRTLDSGTDWLVDTSTDGDMVEGAVWELNDAALQPMFVDGVFEPSFDLTKNNGPELTVAGDDFDNFVDNLAGQLRADFENAYLSTR